MRHAVSRVAVVIVLVGLASAGPAGPGYATEESPDQGETSTTEVYDEPQPESTADRTDSGANAYDCEEGPEGPYCSTRDGSASANGEGDGEAAGRPCAGCVGRADNKNPRGQEPGPEDVDDGYECDGNEGIAEGNPAHTGCTSGTSAVQDDAVTPAGWTTPEEPVTSEAWVDEVAGVEAYRAASVVDPAAADPAEGEPGAARAAQVASSSGVLPATGAAGGLGLLAAGGLGLLAAGGWLLRRRAARSFSS